MLPHGVLAERLAEAYRVIAQLTAQVRELTARVEDAVTENGQLTARVEALERRAGKDSLLTEHGRAFPQLEGLAVALGYTVTARG